MNKGVLYGVLSALFFTASALVTRYVFENNDINALSYVVTFSLTSGVCGAIGLLAKPQPEKFRSRNFKYVFLIAFLGVTALSIVTFSLSLTSATNRNVLTTLVVITTALWSMPILKQRPSKNFYMWTPVLLASVYLVLAGLEPLSFNRGDMLVLVALVIFGANNALGKKYIPEFGPEFIVNFRMVLGAALLLMIGLTFNRNNPLLVTTAGIIPVLAGLMRYINISLVFKSMKYVSATNALVLTMVQVVFTVIGAAMFLQEDITVLKVLGSLLVVFSVYKIVNTKNSQNKA